MAPESFTLSPLSCLTRENVHEHLTRRFLARLYGRRERSRHYDPDLEAIDSSVVEAGQARPGSGLPSHLVHSLQRPQVFSLLERQTSNPRSYASSYTFIDRPNLCPFLPRLDTTGTRPFPLRERTGVLNMLSFSPLFFGGCGDLSPNLLRTRLPLREILQPMRVDPPWRSLQTIFFFPSRWGHAPLWNQVQFLSSD